MPPFDPYAEVPGYKEAVERENALRESAALGITETICGIEVLPLNVKHLILLEGCDSPFFSGGAPEATDIGKFFWIVSPRYSRRPGLRCRLLMRKVRRLQYVNAVQGINDYMEEACHDMLGTSGSERRAFAGLAAFIIHTLAYNYGWTDEQILRQPLKMVWQYFRLIKKENAPDKTITNRTDEMVVNWARNN